MRGFHIALLLIGFAASGPVAAASAATATAAATPELAAVRTIIDAVNRKDADLYASVMAEDVVVQLYDGPVRIIGRTMLRDNRAEHFRRFPATRSEIVHLVQIGDRVVMHDRVWLDNAAQPAQIVEVFSFRDGRIARIEVLQDQRVTDQIHNAEGEPGPAG